MQSKLTGVALLFAILALAVSAYSLTRDGDSTRSGIEPSGSQQQLSDLGKRVDRLAMEFEELRGLRAETRGPGGDSTGAADREEEVGAAGPDAGGDRLKALVDDAVEKKAESVTEKLRLKQTKEPSIEAFATVLGLSGAQRDSVEQEVIRGQGVVFGILETPTEGGRNLLDDLVELYAASIAKPGTDPGWGQWLARVVTEKIPGSDETYGARIEVEKATIRKTFEGIFSKEQYAEFEGWAVDPVEIRGVVGSPGEALGLRIMERAKELGAEVPEGK